MIFSERHKNSKDWISNAQYKPKFMSEHTNNYFLWIYRDNDVLC